VSLCGNCMCARCPEVDALPLAYFTRQTASRSIGRRVEAHTGVRDPLLSFLSPSFITHYHSLLTHFFAARERLPIYTPYCSTSYRLMSGSPHSLGATLPLPTGCWFLFSSWSSLPPSSNHISFLVSGGVGDVTFGSHIVTSPDPNGAQLTILQVV